MTAYRIGYRRNNKFDYCEAETWEEMLRVVSWLTLDLNFGVDRVTIKVINRVRLEEEEHE